MVLGISKQLHHQTSYYLLSGLKLFPRTHSTIACNIIQTGWRMAAHVTPEESIEFGPWKSRIRKFSHLLNSTKYLCSCTASLQLKVWLKITLLRHFTCGACTKYSQDDMKTKSIMVSFYGNRYLFPDVGTGSIIVFLFLCLLFLCLYFICINRGASPICTKNIISIVFNKSIHFEHIA